MKDLAARKGMSSEFEIASAACTTEEIGRDMYPSAKKKLREKGIPFAPRAARLVTPTDYEHFDRLIAMDGENLRRLERLLGPDRDGKIRLMMEYCGERRDVADPWYTGDFEETYQDLSRACAALLEAYGK